MKLATIALLAATLVAFAPTARAQAPDSVRVTFDTMIDGSTVNGYAPANSFWAEWGIHLSRINTDGCTSCNADTTVYATTGCVENSPTISAPNVISPNDQDGCPDFAESFGGSIQAVFDREATFACIGVLPVDPTSYGRLRAFNQSGGLIDQIQSPPGETPSTICIAAPGIHRIEFTAPNGRFAIFDNLTVKFAPVPVQPVTFGAVKAMFR